MIVTEPTASPARLGRLSVFSNARHFLPGERPAELAADIRHLVADAVSSNSLVAAPSARGLLSNVSASNQHAHALASSESFSMNVQRLARDENSGH